MPASCCPLSRTRAWRLTFPDPLVRAAVYGQLGSARRARLHVAAAELVDDHRGAQNHR